MRAEIPWHLKAGANMRGRWKIAKKARSERLLGRVLVHQLSMASKPTLPCTVTLTRIAPRQLDDDNLQNAFKSIRDGIAEALGAKDDSARAGIEWRYRQKRGAAKYYAVRIEAVSASTSQHAEVADEPRDQG